jgi:SAM-dependent methyltransferase
MFESYSDLYDAIYSQKEYKTEVGAVSKIIETYASKASKILDYGCGTGRHAIELAGLGFHVIGIDSSPHMIKIAKERLSGLDLATQARIKFVCADVRNYKSEEKFDVVVSLFHVINYMIDSDHLSDFYSSAHSNLNSSGVLIHDTWNGGAIREENFIPRDLDFEFLGRQITRHSSYSHSEEQHLVKVNFTFDSSDYTKAVRDSWAEEHEIRYFFEEELLEATREKFIHLGTLSSQTLEMASSTEFSPLFVFKIKQ